MEDPRNNRSGLMGGFRQDMRDWRDMRPERDKSGMKDAQRQWGIDMQQWQSQMPMQDAGQDAMNAWLDQRPAPFDMSQFMPTPEAKQAWRDARPVRPPSPAGFGSIGGGGNTAQPGQPPVVTGPPPSFGGGGNPNPPANFDQRNLGMLYRPRPNPWASRNPWGNGGS